MDGHHLILGSLEDFITGEVLDDTLDERYRQKLARALVSGGGYAVSEITPRLALTVKAGRNRAIVKIDLVIRLSKKTGMIIKYGPGSLVTRHRPALAASRLLAPNHIPVVAVTNGEDADVLDGVSGKVLGSGLDAIPSRKQLVRIMEKFSFPAITPERAEMESRIVYAYDVDGGCPCDDTICRL